MNKTLSVIMPVFNEINTVHGTIEKILSQKIPTIDIELIIIESNSTDGTKEIIEKFSEHPNIKVIWQTEAKGKGNAVREGFRNATGDYILINDADNEYSIDDYKALLTPLINEETDFVLGSRYGNSEFSVRKLKNQRSLSHLLNIGHLIFTSLINMILGTKLKDPLTMYKVFKKNCIRDVTFECHLFNLDIELVMKLVRKGYIPIEVPVQYTSRSFKEGKKINIFRDPIAGLYAIIKYGLQKKERWTQIPHSVSKPQE